MTRPIEPPPTRERQPIDASRATAEEIATRVEGVNADQVSAVLASWNNIRQGDIVGMVRRDDATGQVAHRVDFEGVQQWHVSAPDGSVYNDTQGTLRWPVIYDPTPVINPLEEETP